MRPFFISLASLLLIVSLALPVSASKNGTLKLNKRNADSPRSVALYMPKGAGSAFRESGMVSAAQQGIDDMFSSREFTVVDAALFRELHDTSSMGHGDHFRLKAIIKLAKKQDVDFVMLYDLKPKHIRQRYQSMFMVRADLRIISVKSGEIIGTKGGRIKKKIGDQVRGQALDALADKMSGIIARELADRLIDTAVMPLMFGN